MKALNALALLAVLLGCANGHGQNTSKNDPLFSGRPSSVSAIHHLGRGHHIGEFSINGQSCGNAGTPEKNSGSDTMCHIQLPKEWQPGIKYKVKWGVTNWNEDLSALQKGNSGQWFEAEAEIERFSTNYGTEVHFYPDGVVRIVPNLYGPPDSDTRADQTPPLTELPVYPPDWYSLGMLYALEKHESPMPAERAKSLARHRQERLDYYAFLQRLWTARGLTAEQMAGLMAQEQDKERRGIRSGHLSYLVHLLEKQGMDSNAAFEASRPFRQVSQEELDQHIAAQLQRIKSK